MFYTLYESTSEFIIIGASVLWDQLKFVSLVNFGFLLGTGTLLVGPFIQESKNLHPYFITGFADAEKIHSQYL